MSYENLFNNVALAINPTTLIIALYKWFTQILAYFLFLIL